VRLERGFSFFVMAVLGDVYIFMLERSNYFEYGKGRRF
jgi:hypothetical protein